LRSLTHDLHLRCLTIGRAAKNLIEKAVDVSVGGLASNSPNFAHFVDNGRFHP